MDYGRVTPVLAKAIQEQQQLIEELKKENALQVEALAGSAKQPASLQAEVKRIAASMEAIQALVRAQEPEKSGHQTVSTK